MCRWALSIRYTGGADLATELRAEDGGGAGAVAAEAGDAAELVARRGGGRDTAEGLAGSAVVEVGRLAERSAARKATRQPRPCQATKPVGAAVVIAL
jgi:hypothetical protein